MTLLEMSQDELETSGAYWTAREISQQPAVWIDIMRAMARDADALRAYLAPFIQQELRIVLTGAGTSACVGECLAPALTRHMGRRAEAVATTDLVASPESWLAPTAPVLLVSFARSGNSPESVVALNFSEQAVPECHHLIVTCNREGELFRRAQGMRNAHVLLLPEETSDRGFAMTSSFSGLMRAAALAFSLPSPKATASLARWADRMLADFPSAAGLASAGFERVVYLGSNEFKGLAREAALKMLKLTDGRVVALSETPLGFRRGPKTIINSKTLVVMFLCNDPYSRRYELDLLGELRADGIAARVVALTAGGSDRSAHPHDIVVPGASAAPDFDLCFPYAVFAQTLALLQSLALGLRSDSPKAKGVVNRVVQGVSIYSRNPRRWRHQNRYSVDRRVGKSPSGSPPAFSILFGDRCRRSPDLALRGHQRPASKRVRLAHPSHLCLPGPAGIWRERQDTPLHRWDRRRCPANRTLPLRQRHGVQLGGRPCGRSPH